MIVFFKNIYGINCIKPTQQYTMNRKHCAQFLLYIP